MSSLGDLLRGAVYFVGAMVPSRSRPRMSYRRYIGFRRECYGEGVPTWSEAMEYLRWISRERSGWALGRSR